MTAKAASTRRQKAQDHARSMQRALQAVQPLPERAGDRFALARAQEGDAAFSAAPADRALLAPDTRYPPFRADEPLLPGQRWEVRLAIVDDCPFNPRVFYPEASLSELAASLRADGQLVPALAYASPTAPGRLMLKEGHRRRRALELAGLDTLRVEIVSPPTSVLDEFRENRILNTQRNDHTMFDDAVRFSELLKRGLVKDQLSLAALFGLSESQVSKTLTVGELPLSVLERMAQQANQFGSSIAYNVALLHRRRGEAAALRLVERIAAGKLSSRQVEQLLRTLETTADSASAAQARARVLARAEVRGEAQGELKAFGNGRLTLSLAALTDEQRNLLFGRILTLFSECGLQFQSTAPAVSGHDLASG